MQKRLTSKDYREKYREQIRCSLHDKKLKYKIPPRVKWTEVPEKELAWIVSCAITQSLAVKTVEEVCLTKMSRIDIYIPGYKIGVEVKIDGRRSKGSRPGETPKQQLARYKRCKMIDTAYLVSIDGSIGYTIEELIEVLREEIKNRGDFQRSKE